MSGLIHPTALVDPAAHLGAEVRVGPYAIVEANCRIGDRCEIRAHAVICARTVLGIDNQVGYGAVLGSEPQDLGFKGAPTRVEIGARNRIREYATIHRASKEGGVTRLGDDNFLMAGVHLGHDAQVGSRTILANNTLLGGHVQVDDGVFLGGATLVHQWCRIGRQAITRGGTRLTKDLPPYFMAISTNQVRGTNRVGLRRAGLPPETRRAIQAAFDLIYHSDLNVSQALEELRAKFQLPEITHLVDWIAASKRGICRARADRDDENE
jgi:UDP-N-acetylglucosamine acyltransferase